MKKILALLLAAAMLFCLAGCGKDEADEARQSAESAAKSAKSGELHTFAGVGWDTPISECEAALEKGTGVQFSRLEELDPDDPRWADPAYLWDGATFAADPGHYTMLGMTIDATGESANFVPGISAFYTPADGEAERQLVMIRVSSNSYELPERSLTLQEQIDSAQNTVYHGAGSVHPDWSKLQTAQEVFRKIDKRYDGETCVYLTGLRYEEGVTHYYTVPEKELPWLFQDATAFAEAMGWDFLCIGLAQGNVDFYISINLSYDASEYTMTLEYLGFPFGESEFAQELADLAIPFPWVDGEPEYVEIVP